MHRFAALLSSALAGSALLGAARAHGQAPSAAPPAPPEFRTGTAVVALDVIARDKKGRPVHDLQPGEIQVLENDEACGIRSFRLVESPGSVEPAAAVAAPANAAGGTPGPPAGGMRG